MSSEFEQTPEAEPKDRTRWLWLAIVLLIVGMLVVVWVVNREPSTRSRIRISHILIGFDANNPADRQRALEQARAVREQLLEGASFATLAREYSTDKWSAARGGDVGWQHQGQLVAVIEEWAWTAPIGEVSDVLAASYGYHIAVVTGREISAIDQYERSLQERVGGPRSN